MGETLANGRHADIVGLACAIALGGLGYVAIVLLLRGRLPLGRFSK
jgi:hypothetical protein